MQEKPVSFRTLGPFLLCDINLDILFSEPRWKVAVKNIQLMSCAHSDQGSEDYFTITPKLVICYNTHVQNVYHKTHGLKSKLHIINSANL
jgi:hypothetical protein